MDEDGVRKVLVAQGRPTDLKFTSQFLEVLGGYSVKRASDGREMIKALKDKPDVILADTLQRAQFPRALEIIRLNKAFQETPIVIYSEEQHLAPALASKGISGFIVKPTAPAVLLGKLWKALGEGSAEASASSFSERFQADLDGIEDLPTLPTIFAEVDRLCKDPDIGADELSKVIETDPSITLKLLSLANSAFFGFSRRIKTVHEAISLLGNKTVKNAILNIAVYEATKDLDTSAGLDKKALWVHAAGVGSVARFLCKKLSIDRDEAFTAGIVHDIGKIIFDSLYADFYSDVLKQVAAEDVSIYQAEEEVIGLTHAQIGEKLAEAWNLGPELVSAIGYHHSPDRAEGDEEIATLVHIGDVVARRLDVGSGGDSTVPDIDPGALKKLGVSSDQLTEWDQEIQEAVERDRSILTILQS